MAYISPIAVETALRSIDEMAPEAIRHNQAGTNQLASWYT
jgi:hypothetical protein